MTDPFRSFVIQIVREAAHYDGRGDGLWTLQWARDRETALKAAKLLGLQVRGDLINLEDLKVIENAAITAGERTR